MTPSRRPRTVLVVDDNPEFLEASSAWIETRPELRLVGTASNGAEAIERVAALRPDLVLMDAAMPVLDGFEATRRLKTEGAVGRVVIVSFHDSETVRREAWAAGADAFVAKADIARELPEIVRRLAAEASEKDDAPRSFGSENRRADRPPSKQRGT